MVPIYKALLEECKVKGLTNLYRDAKKLSVIVHRMSNTGLKVSQKNLKKLQTWIDIEVNEKESTFRSLGKIPNKLNLASDPDMRTVWLGEKSSKVERLLNKQWQFQPWDQYRGTCSCGTSKWFTQQESKDIKDNPVLLHSFKSKCRKCKTPEWHSVGEIREGKAKSKSTKAYQEILNANQINAYIPPYILTTYKPRTTKEGASQVDKKFREAYITALVKRQEEITQLKAYQEENNSRYEYYRTQYKDIEKLIKMLSAYGEYAGMKKLQETYYHWDVGKDGRLHSDFKVFGTKTGRFSSKKPNLFTFPKSEKAPLLRQIFVPEDGKIFFSADYKGLENFVMAFVTKDRKLLEICADGRDLHDENTMALFDITPDDSRWNLFRSASKTYQFGTAYGGSDNEIYTQIISKFPETKLTLAKFKQAKGNLMKKHPGYANWVDQIVEKANTDRFVETYVNGRKRYLYGNKSDIRKEAMNTPIQGTAADIVNNAMIRIDERLRAEGLTAELVLYVYDELNYELPIEELPMVYKIVMEEMTKPVEILGITRHFKVDPEIGYTLGSLGSFDPETFEVTGSSKHA
jgi:DNA polymerase I-like protein with 3'-5' exonuclease and polymerase domains